MNKQLKAYGSVFVSALLFFLMLDTKYAPALGDYLLTFFKIPAWIEHDGMFTHLTAYIIGGLFIASLIFLKKFRKDQFSGKKTFWTFVIMVTVFYLSTALVATQIKSHQEGLMAVAFVPKSGQYSYRANSQNITQFDFEFELKNYSDDTQTFSVTVNDISHYDEDHDYLIMDLDHQPVIFTLKSGQKKVYHITSDDYTIYTHTPSYLGPGGTGSGTLSSLVLNNSLQTVRQYNEFLYGELEYQNSILD